MKRIFTLLLLGAVWLSGCGSLFGTRSAPIQSEYPMEMPPVAFGEEMAFDVADAPAVSENRAVTSTSSAGDAAERLVIRTASLTLVVPDPKASLEIARQLSEELGGYVVNANFYTTTSENGRQVPTASVTLRVPAETFDTALAGLKTDVVQVRYENISGQDITAEYVDLEARLRSLQAAEAQLERMMEEATDMEDVIAIFNQLTAYREQIEQIQGQLQYYDQAVAMSAIDVTYLAEAGVLPLQIGGWELGTEARRSLQQLIYFVQDFLRLVIRFFLLYLPAIALSVLPLWLLWKIGWFIWKKVRQRIDRPEAE